MTAAQTKQNKTSLASQAFTLFPKLLEIIGNSDRTKTIKIRGDSPDNADVHLGDAQIGTLSYDSDLGLRQYVGLVPGHKPVPKIRGPGYAPTSLDPGKEPVRLIYSNRINAREDLFDGYLPFP